MIDAPAIDALEIDARPPIDGPPPCNGMVCDGVCRDTTTAEGFCGNCTTVCAAGEACGNSACMCAPEEFVVPDPVFIQDQIVTTALPQTSLGIGGYIGSEINALLVAMPDAAVLGMAYPLSGDSPGLPPFVALGYDVDLTTMALAASFYATAGTVTFTARCAGGFAGHADNLTFTPATGLMPPVLVDNKCAITKVDTIAFAYGNNCL